LFGIDDDDGLCYFMGDDGEIGDSLSFFPYAFSDASVLPGAECFGHRQWHSA
jgi:hypothetical protein